MRKNERSRDKEMMCPRDCIRPVDSIRRSLMVNRIHRTATIFIFIAILFIPVLLFSEILYLEVPSLRMGIERNTGLPSFVGIGTADSERLAKNLMPQDISALLETEGWISRLSVTRESANVIRTSWKAGVNAVALELIYETLGDEIRVRLSRGWDASGEISLVMRIPFDPFKTSTTLFSSNKD